MRVGELFRGGGGGSARQYAEWYTEIAQAWQEPLLANGLLSASIPVTVHERDPQHTKREGFQIRLGEAATEGFRACLRPDDVAAIRAAFSQATTGLTAPALCDTKFRTVLDLRRVPSYSGSWGVNRVVLREILLNPLREKGCVKFGRGVEGFEVLREDYGRERVKVHLSHGSEDWCDVLVGADGSGSRINKLLGANNLVTIDSHASVLSKGPLPPDWPDKLPKRLLDGPVMVFGGGRGGTWRCTTRCFFPLRTTQSHQMEINPSLPRLRRRAAAVDTIKRPGEEGGLGRRGGDVNAACEEFEGVMFERAFSWVRKSGGTHVPVSFVEFVLKRLVLTVY
ncbi:putative FAD dependent oxidoreductase [Colletotrichum sojae]|uniref:Putative FAD dependent oxidoreductase n=1 Tax=Colletotrichum sojae TaxID=2175907 RepID=A0A8H6MLR0_9PEZI|nr:putative FAD dependent oxidoreductase [Colletotrichum sojae]